MASISLGTVTLVQPAIISGRNPTSDSEVVLIDGKRDQDQEPNYGTEFVIECQSDDFSDYQAILALIALGTPQELVIDWSMTETPDEESFGYYIISTPSWRMPNISMWCPLFVYQFTIRRHTA